MTWVAIYLYVVGGLATGTILSDIRIGRPFRAAMIVVLWPVSIPVILIAGALS